MVIETNVKSYRCDIKADLWWFMGGLCLEGPGLLSDPVNLNARYRPLRSHAFFMISSLEVLLN